MVSQISEPLDRLINNGQMSESLNHIVSLPEVEPETFTLFAQYAYTGLYQLDHKEGENVLERLSYTNDQHAFCLSCGFHVALRESQAWPYCSQDCFERTQSRYWAFCSVCGLAKSHINLEGRTFSLQCPSSRKTYDDSETSETPEQHRRDRQLRHSHYLKPQSLGMRSCESRSDDLVQHAKLFVFADMYMVEPLQELCLRTLIDDLNQFDITPDTISCPVDYIAYVYGNTLPDSRSGQGGYGTKLRAIALAFAVAEKTHLIRLDEFDEFLQQGGPFVVEFVHEMLKPKLTWRNMLSGNLGG